MRPVAAACAALIAVSLSMAAGPALAAGSWRPGTGGDGGGAWRHGGHPQRGWRGDGWRDGRHGDFDAFRGFGAFGLYAGPPWYWEPDYAYAWPVYRYDDQPSAIYTPPNEDDIISPPAGAAVRYYCPDIGYYPAVATCPQGWLRVSPDYPH